MSLKNEIIETMECYDLIVIDHNVSNVIEIIDQNVFLTGDNFYIFSSWNDFEEIERLTGLKIDDIFENWGFDDEYVSCCNCYNVIHKPDLNHWFDDNYYEFICGDCIREDENLAEKYIDSLINDHKKVNTILSNYQLKNIGFKPCNCNDNQCEFWAGFRNQKQDDPKEILKNAISINPDMDYIFHITATSMFDTDFTLYHRVKI